MKTFIIAAVGAAALASAQVIDNTATRVQTTLEPGMKRIGTLMPKSVREVGSSRWTLGCETIDREYSDYDAFKEYLPALGIKRIRLQGGGRVARKTPAFTTLPGWTTLSTTRGRVGLRSGWKPATAIRLIPAAAGARCQAGFRNPRRA